MKSVHLIFLLSLVSIVTANELDFDVNAGVQTQQDTETVDADELTYTTSGGVPFVHSVPANVAISNHPPLSVDNPYTAQRVGPDGPLLLQDFHLVCPCQVVDTL